MSRRISRLFLSGATALVVLLAASPSHAQSQKARAYLENLFFQGVVDAQESPTQVLQQATDSAEELSKFVATALSTAPVASSSAGFVYVRDASTGELTLKSPSFGPLFAERPLTNGKGVVSFGVNLQHSRTEFNGSFDTADGSDEGLPIFDNTVTYRDGFVQFITKRAFLEARSNTFNFVGGYGVTDRIDVGVQVPFVSMAITGHSQENFDITRTFNAGETNRTTPTGVIPRVAESTLSSKGLGDVVMRVKYAITEGRDSGAALDVSVRLPTGDEETLLGAGKAAVKIQLAASRAGFGPASVHANAGYTAGGLSDELNYVAGVDAALLANKQLTASVSFLGRNLMDAAFPERVPTVRRTVSDGATGVRDVVVDRFIWSPTHLNLMQVAVGAKLSVGGNWLLSGSVLLPVNQRGFQPSVTPAFGIERTWN